MRVQSEETASQEEQQRSLLRKSSEEKRGSQVEVGTSKGERGGDSKGERGGDSNGGQQELQKDSRRLLKLKINIIRRAKNVKPLELCMKEANPVKDIGPREREHHLQQKNQLSMKMKMCHCHVKTVC